jgi:transposase
VGAHHLNRKLMALGHDARLMPAKYVRPYSKGQKNDFRDAEAIAEAVQRPTMKFVATKSADQLDLQALHRVRERLVSQRTGIINQIRAFLLERGIAVRQGASCGWNCPASCQHRPISLSPRMLRLIEGLASDWRRLDERIESRAAPSTGERKPPGSLAQARSAQGKHGKPVDDLEMALAEARPKLRAAQAE